MASYLANPILLFSFFQAICYHFSLVAGCRGLLKNCIWVEVRQFFADFSFDDLQISFAVHHALDRYKRSRSVNRKATPEHLFVWVLHCLHKNPSRSFSLGRTANEFWIEIPEQKNDFRLKKRTRVQSSSDQSLCFFCRVESFLFHCGGLQLLLFRLSCFSSFF